MQKSILIGPKLATMHTLLRAVVPLHVIPLGNCTVTTNDPEQPDGTDAQESETGPLTPTAGVVVTGAPHALVMLIA